MIFFVCKLKATKGINLSYIYLDKCVYSYTTLLHIVLYIYTMNSRICTACVPCLKLINCGHFSWTRKSLVDLIWKIVRIPEASYKHTNMHGVYYLCIFSTHWAILGIGWFVRSSFFAFSWVQRSVKKARRVRAYWCRNCI